MLTIAGGILIAGAIFFMLSIMFVVLLNKAFKAKPTSPEALTPLPADYFDVKR